jgi:ribosome-associated protein
VAADRDLSVRKDLIIPAGELGFSASRSGGPGGQHVNRTASRVTLRWSVTDSRVLSDARRARLRSKLAARLTNDGELIVHADTERSQLENKRLARERLAGLVREALKVPKARRKSKPTRAARERRLEGKRRRSDIKRRRRRPPRED